MRPPSVKQQVLQRRRPHVTRRNDYYCDYSNAVAKTSQSVLHVDTPLFIA